MSYTQNLENYKDYDKVKVKCDDCNKVKEVLYICARRQFKKRGGHFCASCAAKKSPKPQNQSSFWTEEKKKKHSECVRTESYYDGISSRDQSGEKNGMYGKEHTPETKSKMSKSRTGKLGPNATAWKGGKSSITKRVKGVLHTRFNWYGRVYKRDGWKCTECKKNGIIDAHHKEPIVKIIKRLTNGKTFANDEEKIEWLVAQPEIADPNLENGVTLCRDCHRKEHGCWGSHKKP
jgi:hypothetical protein